MRSRILLAVLLATSLGSVAGAEEYHLRVEHVEVSYDDTTNVDELLKSLTVWKVEATVRPGQAFEATTVEGDHKLSMKGIVSESQDFGLTLDELCVGHNNGHGGVLGRKVIDPKKLEQFTGGMWTIRSPNGERVTVINKSFVIAWKLPLDDKAVALQEAAIANARQTLMRNEMINLRREAFTKEKATATMLDLARQHLASGDARVGILLLDSFKFEGKEARDEAVELRRSLSRQIEHLDSWKISLE